MNILLVNPPIRLSAPPYIHPFGLGIIANMLRTAGHNVSIADVNAARNERGAVFHAPHHRPDLIGIGGIISTFAFVSKFMPILRETYPGVPVIIGGGGVTSAPEVYMRVMAPDLAVLGEGEYTTLELAEHFETGHPPLEDIAGIIYPRDGELVRTRPRVLEKNLDVFPMPAFDLFDMEAYITHPKYSKVAEREAAIIATRGCSFGCTFCYHVFGRGVRYRSVSHVMAEVRHLVDHYGVGALLWADEFWTANRKFVREICSELVDLNLDWMCYSRVDVLTDEILVLMKQAGCSLIGLGLESGSQRILDAMRKGTTVEQNKAAWQMIRRNGIRVVGSLIFGYPGEDDSTIRETVEFCKEIDHRGAKFYLTPYPGTVVFDENKEKILETFGSLEEFFSRLGDATEFVVNLTGWPDKWLAMSCSAARMEIAAHNIMQEALHADRSRDRVAT